MGVLTGRAALRMFLPMHNPMIMIQVAGGVILAFGLIALTMKGMAIHRSDDPHQSQWGAVIFVIGFLLCGFKDFGIDTNGFHACHTIAHCSHTRKNHAVGTTYQGRIVGYNHFTCAHML